jgi:pyrroloquinoline quinone biosynthesis protein B
VRGAQVTDPGQADASPAAFGAAASLRLLVLGAAAGGGLPQWNCACVNCRAARRGDIKPSTQASLAVSADGSNWFLINASPDCREQIAQTPQLHPPGLALRQSPIAGVFVTNGEVDAIAGLLSLREGSPFSVYAHPQVLAVLKNDAIFNVLGEPVRRNALAPGESFAPGNRDGSAAALTVEPFLVPGKEALFLEGQHQRQDATLGLTIRSASACVHVVTACSLVSDDLKQRLDGADAVFFDGTLWRDDEMIAAGLSPKTGQRMGHLAMSGPEGGIARLADIKVGRRIFIHINNSNPVWRTNSPERREAERAGWEIAFDGMEVLL